MRADRLIAILMLLQARGRMKARELAEELEVSERTIYRDTEALSAAGVPVFAERGHGGGCYLLDGYRTNLTGLNEQELRALFLSTVPVPLRDLGLTGAAEGAMLKLSAALPSVRRGELEQMRQRVLLDPTLWFQTEEPVPHLRTIQEAAWQNRRLEITYRRTDGQVSRQQVEPYGLVAKGSIWYFVGSSATQVRAYRVARLKQARRELRTYRVSRVLSAQLCEEQFERPEGFDLAKYWTEWCEQFEKSLPSYQVTLRVRADYVATLARSYGEGIRAQADRAGQPDDEGCITLALTFESEDSACSHMLSLGSSVEIVAPEQLRDQVLEAARRVVAHYESQKMPLG